MGSNARTGSDSTSVTLSRSDEYFVATDELTGVTSQGETRVEALENLADALKLYEESDVGFEEDDLEPSNAPWL